MVTGADLEQVLAPANLIPAVPLVPARRLDFSDAACSCRSAAAGLSPDPTPSTGYPSTGRPAARKILLGRLAAGHVTSIDVPQLRF
jgi:hypothetical protein